MIHTVQPKHSPLSVKRLQRCSQTALGGWMDGGQRGERERETLLLTCGKRLSSLPRNMKPQSILTSRALDPEYSRWWHFTMCGRWGFAETGESVWSIDHCYCCPCLLCVSQCRLILRKGETKREGWRCKAHLFNGDEPNWNRIREICLRTKGMMNHTQESFFALFFGFAVCVCVRF